MVGAVAQLVEQRTENPCVGGSIPPHTTESLIKSEAFLFCEHPVRYPPWRKRTENPCVGGSIPPHTTSFKNLVKIGGGFLQKYLVIQFCKSSFLNCISIFTIFTPLSGSIPSAEMGIAHRCSLRTHTLLT